MTLGRAAHCRLGAFAAHLLARMRPNPRLARAVEARLARDFGLRQARLLVEAGQIAG